MLIRVRLFIYFLAHRIMFRGSWSGTAAAPTSASITGIDTSVVANEGVLATVGMPNIVTTGSTTSSGVSTSKEPSEAAVLAFLANRGLTKAVQECRDFLESEKKASDDTVVSSSVATFVSTAVKLCAISATRGEQRFNSSTGGGLGYEVDSLPCMNNNNNNQPPPNKSSVSGSNSRTLVNSADANPKRTRSGWDLSSFIQSLTALQTWVLNLPDDPSNPSSSSFQLIRSLRNPNKIHSPSQELILQAITQKPTSSPSPAL